MSEKNLEETIKDKILPIIEKTMEKQWGFSIPKVEIDITDKLKRSNTSFYIPFDMDFPHAKKIFKREFLKKELRMHKCNISLISKFLDIDRRSIHRAINELGIDIDRLRNEQDNQDPDREVQIYKAIRSTFDSYRSIIQPKKMEEMYEEMQTLSRNIAKIIPHMDMTWKEAEKQFEKQFLEHSLQKNNYDVRKTAKEINIRIETIYRKIKQLEIKNTK